MSHNDEEIDDGLEQEMGTIVLMGSQDSGKSCLAATLCFSSDEDEERLSNLKSEYESMFHAVSQYEHKVWLSDTGKNEREAQTTLRGNCHPLTIWGNLWNVIDTPGDPRYGKRVVQALGLADVLLLVVSVHETQLVDLSAPSGLFAQRLSMAFMFGVRQVIVCITKLDELPAKDQEQAYVGACFSAASALKSVGFLAKRHRIHFVPTCTVNSMKGANVFAPDPNTFPWWTGTSLKEHLRTCTRPRGRHDACGVMLVHSWHWNETLIASGFVLQGSFVPRRRLLSLPGHNELPVSVLERWREIRPQVFRGDMAGLEVQRNISLENAQEVLRQTLIFDADDQFDPYPENRHVAPVHGTSSLQHHPEIPDKVRLFVADIRLVRTRLHKRRKHFDIGTTCTFSNMLVCTKVHVVAILARLDGEFNVVERHPQRLHRKDVLRVLFRSDDPVFVQKGPFMPRLERMVLSDDLGVVGAGVVRKKAQGQTLVAAIHTNGQDSACQDGLAQLLEEDFLVEWRLIPRTLTKEALNGVQLLVTCMGRSRSEHEVLVDFVKSGGSLLKLVDHRRGTDRIVTEYGLERVKREESFLSVGRLFFRGEVGAAKRRKERADQLVTFESVLRGHDSGRWATSNHEDLDDVSHTSSSSSISSSSISSSSISISSSSNSGGGGGGGSQEREMAVAREMERLAERKRRKERKKRRKQRRKAISKLQESTRHRLLTSLTQEEILGWNQEEVMRFVTGHRQLAAYRKSIHKSGMVGKNLLEYGRTEWEAVFEGEFAGEIRGRKAMALIASVLDTIADRVDRQNNIDAGKGKTTSVQQPSLTRTLSAQEVLEDVDGSGAGELGEAMETLTSEASIELSLEESNESQSLRRTESWAQTVEEDADGVDVEDLPDEVWMRVFSFLHDDVHAMCALAQTCGLFNDLVDREENWQALCATHGALGMLLPRNLLVDKELAEALLDITEFKLRFYAFWDVTRAGTFGCLSRGVHGKGRWMESASRDTGTSLDVMESLPGVKIVASRTKRRGGGAMLVYARPGHHLDNRRGQALFLVDDLRFGEKQMLSRTSLTNPSNNARVWLKNFAHVASLTRIQADSDQAGSSSSSSA